MRQLLSPFLAITVAALGLSATPAASVARACDEDEVIVDVVDPGEIQSFEAPMQLAYGYGGGVQQQAFAAPQFAPSACDYGAQQAPQQVIVQQAPRVVYQRAPQRQVIVRQQAPRVIVQRAPVYRQQSFGQRTFIGRSPAFAPGGGGGGTFNGRKIKIKKSPGAQIAF